MADLPRRFLQLFHHSRHQNNMGRHQQLSGCSSLQLLSVFLDNIRRDSPIRLGIFPEFFWTKARSMGSQSNYDYCDGPACNPNHAHWIFSQHKFNRSTYICSSFWDWSGTSF